MAVKISIRPNGPYLVEGEVELVDVDGNTLDTSGRGPRFALCRCGASVTNRWAPRAELADPLRSRCATMTGAARSVLTVASNALRPRTLL